MFRPICIVLATCISFGVFSPSIFACSRSNLNQDKTNELIPFLKAVESIPDALLEEGNSNRINQYFRDRGIIISVYNEKRRERVRSKREGNACKVEGTLLLASNTVSILKIKKLKNIIKRLGGATNAIIALEKRKEALKHYPSEGAVAYF